MQENATACARSIMHAPLGDVRRDVADASIEAPVPGVRALSDADLLALVLAARGHRTAPIDASRAILDASDHSLREIARMPAAWLARLPNVGRARAAALHAAFELARRYRTEPYPPGTVMSSPRAVAALMAPQLQDLPVQECHLVLLDRDLRLDRVVFLTRGTLNATIIHPRDVFREAFAARAAAVVVVHNHPCGDPTPSPEDRIVTRELVAAGTLLGIPVLDHIVIGWGRYVSFAQSGFLTADATAISVPRDRRIAEDRWRHVVRERNRDGGMMS